LFVGSVAIGELAAKSFPLSAAPSERFERIGAYGLANKDDATPQNLTLIFYCFPANCETGNRPFFDEFSGIQSSVSVPSGAVTRLTLRTVTNCSRTNSKCTFSRPCRIGHYNLANTIERALEGRRSAFEHRTRASDTPLRFVLDSSLQGTKGSLKSP
jgi:hypothetical protein